MPTTSATPALTASGATLPDRDGDRAAEHPGVSPPVTHRPLTVTRV